MSLAKLLENVIIAYNMRVGSPFAFLGGYVMYSVMMSSFSLCGMYSAHSPVA